jgi:hypothetical protein
VDPSHYPVRTADRSIIPRCPNCYEPLPRLVSLSDPTELTVALRCQCGFEVSYMGPGLIVDRRQHVRDA